MESDFASRARAHQDSLAKPPGSLGRLETIASDLCVVQRTESPQSRPAACVIFAADHPVSSEESVSAYPTDITASMMTAFLAGGAASSVMARHLGLPVHLVDVGVAYPYSGESNSDVKIDRTPVPKDSCGNLRIEDALTPAGFDHAWQVGERTVAAHESDRVLLLGEMGIGNSTPASAIAASLIEIEPTAIVGRGTGIDDETLARKIAVVTEALRRVGTCSAIERLRRLGGPEIVALTSTMIAASKAKKAVLVDGFIATSAALAATAIEPECRQALFFAHRSAEPGHRIMLDHLAANPLLDLEMRLGEATGTLAALPLLDLACTLHRDMWRIADLGKVGAKA